MTAASCVPRPPPDPHWGDRQESGTQAQRSGSEGPPTRRARRYSVPWRDLSCSEARAASPFVICGRADSSKLGDTLERRGRHGEEREFLSSGGSCRKGRDVL